MAIIYAKLAEGIMRKILYLDQCFKNRCRFKFISNIIEPRHEISNNVVCATSNASDQPVHTRSLLRAFASRLNIL